MEETMKHSHNPVIVLCMIALLSLSVGCSGARSHIKAQGAVYPVSFSPAIRNSDGSILMEDDLTEVGDFDFTYTTRRMFWKIIPLSRNQFDLSDEINRQIREKGGEGIVNLNVTHSQNWWTAFASIITLGLAPTSSDVELKGKIVKRKETGQ